MRSMEEDCRGGEFSEDEHPSTDASEDSVEVQVKPIGSFPSNLSRLPRKFRKAFQKNLECSSEGDDFLVEESSSQVIDIERTESNSPVDFSSKSIKTGRASPPLPRSPSPTLRVRGNKRKLSEPRKHIEQDLSPATANSVEDEAKWSPRKMQRVEENVFHGMTTPGLPPSASNFLGNNPFIGHLVPHQLLLPPAAWNPVVRYPYAHLVGLAPQLGFLPTSPYPLLPILPTLSSPSQVSSPYQHHSKPTELPDVKPKTEFYPKYNKETIGTSATKSSTNSSLEKLIKISTKDASPNKANSRIVQHKKQSQSFSNGDITKKSSAIKSSAIKNTSNNFHSVESILSSSSSKSSTKKESSSNKKVLPDLLEISHVPPPTPSICSIEDDCSTEGNIQSLLQNQQKQKQRNYKNMTRERRIEANARERTRVHTISAAFETLRQTVPSFSHNQKLSKLSVLRIASAYILSLSRLAGDDYSLGESSPSFEECVDLTTKTIQIEGKAKKKREE